MDFDYSFTLQLKSGIKRNLKALVDERYTHTYIYWYKYHSEQTKAINIYAKRKLFLFKQRCRKSIYSSFCSWSFYFSFCSIFIFRIEIIKRQKSMRLFVLSNWGAALFITYCCIDAWFAGSLLSIEMHCYERSVCISTGGNKHTTIMILLAEMVFGSL